MRHDAQLDLRVVGAGNHPARRRHKGRPHATALGRADGDVLQIGFVARQPPGDGNGLRIVRVHAAGARVGQLGQLVGVGALELGQAAVLQQLGRQRVVQRQFFQHLFVGAARAGGGFLHHRHAQLVKENLTQLLGAGQVERLAGNLIRLGFQPHDALAQFVALRGQCGCVDQHAIALDAKQRFAAGHFQCVDATQLVVGLQLRPQHQVHPQRLVGVFTGVLRCFGDIDLRKGNLVRALAAQVFVAQTAAPQVAFGQAGQAMRLVHFQHIALQHGVVDIAAHSNAAVGKHMAVVFDMLAELGAGGVFQPRLEFGQDLIERQLPGRVRPVVAQRHISGFAWRDAE